MFETFYSLFGSSPCNPQDLTSIYTLSGIFLLAFSIGLSCLFYLVVNGFSAFYKFSKKIHWWMFALFNSILLFSLSYIICSSNFCDEISYIIVLGLVNAIFGFVLFSLSGLVFKRFSLHAKFVWLF